MDCIHCNKTEKPWLNNNYPCKVYYCSYQPGGEAARHWNYDPKGLNEVRSTYCNARYCDNFTPAGEDILSHAKAQRHEEKKEEQK